MSTEGPIDPNLIEQTKQQIRTLVSEIAHLAKEDIAPDKFYGGFLTRVVSALAAVGGAVWTTNDEGRLALQYEINLHETKLRESEEAQTRHSKLLYKALTDGEPVILPPHSSEGEDGAGNPTDFLLLLGLIKTDLETGGIVEVFQRTDSGLATQKGYLRFLVQMCELAGDYLKSHQLRHFSDRQSLWTQLEDFTRVVHTSLDPRETAFTIANEGRRLIECDRLSVAIRKGNKCVVEAISGQDVFDKRSNLVRLLNKLASAVVATGDPVWYTGDTRDMAPQVEDAVQDYVDEAHSKTVAVLPLARPEPPEEDDPKKRPDAQPCIGALVVEQIEDSRVPASMLPRVDVVCKHSSTALANSLEHQSLFLMPLWRAIGHSRWVVRARTLPKTLSICGAVLAVILFLCLWRTDLEIQGKGTLEPIDRRDVFATVDKSVVQDLLVHTGERVKAGQLLVRLRGPDVDYALKEAQGKLDTAEKALRAKNWQIDHDQHLKQEEVNRMIGEAAELEENIVGLTTQRDLLLEKKQELLVKSPIDGTVVTWHLKDLLTARPLQMGAKMMRVADLSKEWQLELHVPEQRMGFVEESQQKLYFKEREELKKLLLAEKHAEAASTAQKAPAEAAPPQTPSAQTADAAPGESGATPAATEATVDPLLAAVDAELAKIPDEKLHDRWSLLAKAKFDAEIKDILKDMPDGDAKNDLTAVLALPNYDVAWECLSALKANMADDDLKAKLAAIPQQRFVDENVTFILATEPGTHLSGRITEISKSAEIHGDEGVTVLVKVAIDKSQIPDLKSGAEVTAKVHCGRTSLGYAWLHEVISAIQSKIIFRYF